MYNTFTIKNALLNQIIFITISIVQLPFLKLMFQAMFYWANTERNHYSLHHCANINLEVIAHVSYEKAKCPCASGPVWPFTWY